MSEWPKSMREWLDEHLCQKCSAYHVCKVSLTIDEIRLITVSKCAYFRRNEKT